VDVVTAQEPGQVLPALQRIEQACAGGLHAAGFISYEAAPGLDAAFRTREPGPVPLLWFGLFESIQHFDLPAPAGTEPEAAPLPGAERPRSEFGMKTLPVPGDPETISSWEPSMSRDDYGEAIAGIKRYLHSGDTYQVNYSFRLRAASVADPWDLFLHLAATQPASHRAFLDTGRFAVCSASPELFFSLDGDVLVSKPMKGTAGRGRTVDEDRKVADALFASGKNRAENVMIVDMVRNDMGRVAEPGSVHVPALFSIERYPTVWQMTSTVESRTTRSFVDIVQALFPCASITGAPKVRTMEIIRELEPDPRGVYTGAIGHVSPGRRAEFSVAIRTVVADRQTSRMEYGVGGGIVWDSCADSEYAECTLKAAILAAGIPSFDLLESVLWEKGQGYFLLDGHVERLTRSAGYFGRPLDADDLRQRLGARAGNLQGEAFKVRVLLASDGSITIDPVPVAAGGTGSRSAPGSGAASGSEDHADGSARPWTVRLASSPVDPADRFLYHKTTNRAVYEKARRGAPEVDDVILWNADGEVTESTVANVVAELDGQLVTPPVSSGLLPGVFREWLLDRGEIREEKVRVEDLERADRVFLVNSVRRWIEVRLEP